MLANTKHKVFSSNITFTQTYLPLLVCIFVGSTCSAISCGDVATM